MPIKPDVQLSLTKEQYKTLVELVSLGQWMANSIREKRIKKYDEFAEKELAAMTREELDKVRDALVAQYEDESIEHGLDRLEIKAG
jgi:hypothetical protein